jgi:zinc protease
MNYTLGGGGFSSRLMDRVRDDLGLAYDIRSSFDPYMHSGLFYVQVQTGNETAQKVLEEIRSIIDQVREQGVTQKELDAAKAYLTGSFPRRMSTMGKLAGLLASAEHYGLGLEYPEEYVAAINALTLDDVKEAARRHIRPGEFVLSVAGDLDVAGFGKEDGEEQ